MAKIFNVTADCKPTQHYMVNLNERLMEIKKLIDAGQYFTINRARQYGKTTTLRALNRYLQTDYVVVLMDFQTSHRSPRCSMHPYKASIRSQTYHTL